MPYVKNISMHVLGCWGQHPKSRIGILRVKSQRNNKRIADDFHHFIYHKETIYNFLLIHFSSCKIWSFKCNSPLFICFARSSPSPWMGAILDLPCKVKLNKILYRIPDEMCFIWDNIKDKSFTLNGLHPWLAL